MAKKDFGDSEVRSVSAVPAGITGGPASSAHQPESARPCVLIVDDERDTADSLQMLLTDMGYEADVAYDGVTALAMFETATYSVILLDLAMPGIDGFEVAQRMRAAPAGCPPIIAVTGWADLKTSVRARGAGIVRCLVKPVELTELQRWLALFTATVPASSEKLAPA